jgi:hypothetical protein
MNQVRCIRCESPMEEGFIIGRDELKLVQRELGVWVSGKPSVGFFGGIRADDRKQIPLVGYRCPVCAYVELRAPSDGGP